MWALLPLGLALNLGLGKLAVVLRLPLYLDSTGTVLLGVLCGPAAGGLTGGLTTLLMTLTGDLYTGLFVASGVAVGALAGGLARLGLFSRPGPAALAGLFTGLVAAGLSAPVVASLRGGITGAGTDLLVVAFRAAGSSTLVACFAQSLLSDPLDKLITFVMVQSWLAALPATTRSRFSAGASLAVMKGMRWSPARARRTGAGGRLAPLSLPTASGLYQVSEGWLHRRAVGSKLMLLLTAGLAALVTGLPAALPLVAATLFGVALSAGLGLPLARLLSALWLPPTLTLALLEAWLGPGPRDAEWGYSLAGLTGAVTLSLRLAVLLQGLALLLMSTRVEHLGAHLERWGCPGRLVFAVLAALQLGPSLQRRLIEINRAQAARGLDARRQGLTGLVALAGPLLLGTLTAASERSLALQARGLGASRRRTWLEPPPGDAWDPWLQITLLCLAGGLLWWRCSNWN